MSGYTHKTLMKKKHTKQTAKGGGGYSGVSVAGSYYAADQDYSFDHIFGLSVFIIRRPAAVPVEPDEPTPEEVANIQTAIGTQRPAQPQLKQQMLQKVQANMN